MPRVSFRLRITSILPTDLGHIPFAPEIDFPALIASAGADGVLDPNSIEVYAGARRVEYALGDGLLYGDRRAIPTVSPSTGRWRNWSSCSRPGPSCWS